MSQTKTKPKSLRAELDQELVLKMQTGTKAEKELAFNQLYKAYKSGIYFTAYKFLKSNYEVARDTVQEIFMKIYEKIDQYNPESGVFSTWLYNIAHNTLIDIARTKRYEILSLDQLTNKSKEENDGPIEFVFQFEDKHTDVFKDIITQERAQIVHNAINSLKNEKAKTVISLIFIAQFSYKETADKMELPLGTVKTIMKRATTEMRKHIVQRNFDYGRICKSKIKK